MKEKEKRDVRIQTKEKKRYKKREERKGEKR